MRIIRFSPGFGHLVLIPLADLHLFQVYVAQMSTAEREEYAPLSLSDEQPTDGSAHYFIGLHRTHAEVLQFLAHVITDD